MANVLRVATTITGPPALSPPAMNIWHLGPAGVSISTSDAQAAVDKIRDFYTSCAGVFTGTTSIQIGSRVTYFDAATPAIGTIVGITARNVTGSASSTALPPQVALVMSWSGVFIGPRFRGRTYLGPLAQVAQDTNGRADSTKLATINTAAATLVAALAALPTPCPLVVYSRKYLSTSNVTTGLANNVFDTQRRRA